MEDPQTRPQADAPGAEPNGSDPHGRPPTPDPAALHVLLDALRLAAPAELQDRLTALTREALLTLRALIDWYLERLDQAPPERKLEDIPIE